MLFESALSICEDCDPKTTPLLALFLYNPNSQFVVCNTI